MIMEDVVRTYNYFDKNVHILRVAGYFFNCISMDDKAGNWWGKIVYSLVDGCLFFYPKSFLSCVIKVVDLQLSDQVYGINGSRK